jgi:hypothetical protein
MNQTIKLNVIPFDVPVEEVEFAFYKTNPNNFCRIHKDDLNGLLEDIIDESELHEGKWLYTDFQPAKENTINIKVNLYDNVYFSLHYYRYLIRNYFFGKADIMHSNFTKEIEVYFHNKQLSDNLYKVYNQFTLKVQHSRLTDGPELVVSYDGTTKVYNKSLAEIADFQTQYYNWINCNGVLHRWKYLTDAQKLNHDKNYPVLSNTLKPHLGIKFDIPTFENRYPKYLKILDEFYNNYINNDEFRKIIPLATEGYFTPPDDTIRIINPESNELQYSNGKVGRDPKKDFKSKGPFKSVPPPNNVKFFFIYQKSDKETAVKAIYNYLKNGFYHERFPFPSMNEYIRLPFEIDLTGNIEYENLNEAISTVHKAIKNKEKLPDTKYLAIYINPVPKADKDVGRNAIYYRLKEILLNEGILSQVIKTEHIHRNGYKNNDFNTFLPHLQIAMLAKLGGIPWRLNRPTTNELIVGVGAFFSVSQKTRFVGSAFCFNNEGIFKGFDCFNANDTISLAGSIREAVLKFIVTNHKADRLIIHFYKDIGKNELRPILDTLHKLGLNIPVIILTINKTESKELLGFDTTDTKNLMPYSGTIIKVGRKEYLLFNNTRYDENSSPKKKEYHFPVKISLACSESGMLDDMDLVEQLIDQVYQFSRMYWKSTDQQSLPVTIKYPEMVAQIYPYFQHDKLPDFGKESLWFL